MPIGHLSIRIDASRRDHHLWLNNGVWWIHYTLHWEGKKRRIRRSLATREFEAAIRLRDECFARIDAEGIAKGVVGGSTANKVGGAGGKALQSVLLGKKHARKTAAPDPYGMGDSSDGRYVMRKDDTKNMLLVSDAMSTIDEKGREQDERPWGGYLVLDDDASDHRKHGPERHSLAQVQVLETVERHVRHHGEAVGTHRHRVAEQSTATAEMRAHLRIRRLDVRRLTDERGASLRTQANPGSHTHHGHKADRHCPFTSHSGPHALSCCLCVVTEPRREAWEPPTPPAC